MRTRGRSFIVFLTILAMVVANAVGPQLAYAAHHPAAGDAGLSSDHHDYSSHSYKDHATEAEQSRAAADTRSGVGDQSNICCFTVTCTATGDIIAAPAPPAAPLPASDTPLQRDDSLRTFNTRAIDPPPKFV